LLLHLTGEKKKERKIAIIDEKRTSRSQDEAIPNNFCSSCSYFP
jgi:hypothetical protein